MIYEDIVDKKLVERSHAMGYKDFKYLIHGNQDSGALNLALYLSKDSPVRGFIACVILFESVCTVVVPYNDVGPCSLRVRNSTSRNPPLGLPLRDSGHLGLPAQGLRPPVGRDH
jgi:hypothetical protein